MIESVNRKKGRKGAQREREPTCDSVNRGRGGGRQRGGAEGDRDRQTDRDTHTEK